MEQHLAQQIAALKEENRELREELHREQLQSQSRVEEELSSTVINLIAAVAAVADDATSSPSIQGANEGHCFYSRLRRWRAGLIMQRWIKPLHAVNE